jgi:hypothetical protein
MVAGRRSTVVLRRSVVFEEKRHSSGEKHHRSSEGTAIAGRAWHTGVEAAGGAQMHSH